ncbi:MAG: hypothetical protein M1469_02590 [Bacteroidetes bacterium]|nr:hypothetical protein [Bacteroidota bacterium]
MTHKPLSGFVLLEGVDFNRCLAEATGFAGGSSLQLGLRKARYFGTKKVLFQLAMTAAVANFALVAARAANLSPFFSALIYVSVLVAATTLLSSIASQWYLNLSTPAGRTHHRPLDFTNMGFRPGF